MHDLDGNGHWDENEVRVLFRKELEKAYDPNNPEDDMKEREEEMERMREHVFRHESLLVPKYPYLSSLLAGYRT
jgi:hypothetical protein